MNQFNHLYSEFVFQLMKTFPKMTRKLPNYDQYKELDYLNDFVKYNLPFMDYFSVGNMDVFMTKYKDVKLVSGLSLKLVLKQSPPALVEAILNYMRDLYDLAHKTGKMLKLSKKINDNYIVERISAIDHHDAIMKNFLNIEEEVPEYESSDDDEEPNLLESFLGASGVLPPGMAAMMGGTAGAGGLPDPTALFGQLENSEIGRLAKELYESMGDEEMQELSDIGRNGLQNPMAMMSQLMGATNGSGSDNVIGNLVERTVTNIQEKMDSGEIDMERMMSDVQGFLNVLDPSGSMASGMQDPDETLD